MSGKSSKPFLANDQPHRPSYQPPIEAIAGLLCLGNLRCGKTHLATCSKVDRTWNVFSIMCFSRRIGTQLSQQSGHEGAQSRKPLACAQSGRGYAISLMLVTESNAVLIDAGTGGARDLFLSRRCRLLSILSAAEAEFYEWNRIPKPSHESTTLDPPSSRCMVSCPTIQLGPTKIRLDITLDCFNWRFV